MIDLYAEALETFDTLFAEALAGGEPDRTAMQLATATPEGRPSLRTVLLKAHDARGFVFYTHLDGRKGRELKSNPRAALLFHWPRVRLACSAHRGAWPLSTRPRRMRISPAAAWQPAGAWASRQSETLDRARSSSSAWLSAPRVRRPRGAAPPRWPACAWIRSASSSGTPRAPLA